MDQSNEQQGKSHISFLLTIATLFQETLRFLQQCSRKQQRNYRRMDPNATRKKWSSPGKDLNGPARFLFHDLHLWARQHLLDWGLDRVLHESCLLDLVRRRPLGCFDITVAASFTRASGELSHVRRESTLAAVTGLPLFRRPHTMGGRSGKPLRRAICNSAYSGIEHRPERIQAPPKQKRTHQPPHSTSTSSARFPSDLCASMSPVSGRCLSSNAACLSAQLVSSSGVLPSTGTEYQSSSLAC